MGLKDTFKCFFLIKDKKLILIMDDVENIVENMRKKFKMSVILPLKNNLFFKILVIGYWL